MKKVLISSAVCLAAAVTTISSLSLATSLAPGSCGLVFNNNGPESWRASSTNIAFGLTPAKTSVNREQWLKDASKSMMDFLEDKNHAPGQQPHPDTPEMVFAAEEGVVVTAPAKAIVNNAKNTIPLNYTTDPKLQGYHYDEVPRIEVSGLGPSGILRGTLLLPVSSHTGMANAAKWAKTDTYDLYVLDASGKRILTIANSAPSRDFITAHELEIQMQPGQTYLLQYARSGSGGPSGYSDGRGYYLTWNGK